MPGSQRTVQAPMLHGIPVFVKKLDITMIFDSLWNLFWTESIKVVVGMRWCFTWFGHVWGLLLSLLKRAASLAGSYCSSCSKRTCCRQGLFWMFMTFLEFEITFSSWRNSAAQLTGVAVAATGAAGAAGVIAISKAQTQVEARWGWVFQLGWPPAIFGGSGPSSG